MALIDCPECGRSISDKAGACPGCGLPASALNLHGASSSQPSKKPKKKRGTISQTFIWTFWIFVIIMMLGLFAPEPTNQDRAMREQQRNASQTRSRVVSSGAAVSVAKKPEDVYIVLTDDEVGSSTRTVGVALTERVSEKELARFAAEIKAMETKNYRTTYIFYRILGMPSGQPGWATTHYNPDLEIHILGMTDAEARKTEQKSKAISGDVLGRWVNNGVAGGMVSISSNNGVFVLEKNYRDGSSGKKKLKEVSHAKGRRFNDVVSGFAEYYIILSNGKLEVGDRDGLIYVLNPK